MAVKKKAPRKTTPKRKNTVVKKVATKVAEAKANEPETREGKYTVTYDLFTEFMALPSVVRGQVFNDKEGNPIETQKDFCLNYNIPETRISEYKRTEEYQSTVSRKRRQYFKGEIGDAIYAVMANLLVNPKGADLKVLLEYTKEVERDDPLGETSETLNEILKKLNNMIPG